MELEIFSDETYVFNKKYVGIGCLFVPTSYKYNLVNRLLACRCLNEENINWAFDQNSCDNFKKGNCKNEFHYLNNCEIHYANYRKGMSYSLESISTKWIKLLVNNNRLNPNEKIYFNILFLDLKKLDSKFFGEDKTGNNIYNRFYKTTIIGPLKYFFKKYNHITVKEIFHDISDDKNSHEYFRWHTPFILDNERNITVKEKEITFIDSNHKKYNYNSENYFNSTLIQFIDLILGCTSHAIFRESEDIKKMELYEQYYPLISRLWEDFDNKNSRFKYFRSQQVSIFPRDKITYQRDLWGNKKRSQGKFHRDIKLMPPSISSTNYSLDDFSNFKI